MTPEQHNGGQRTMSGEDALAAIHAYDAEAQKLLPAWFIPRMMNDVWYFGLVLTSGHTLLIDTIVDIQCAADGTIWLDVRLLDGPCGQEPDWLVNPIYAIHPERATASVNAAHVICALELAST